ncbi:amidohydrolase family protein [Candidatus Latescibacterota bacterium]
MKKKSTTQPSVVIALLLMILFSGALCYGQTAPAVGLHSNTPNVIALTNARITLSPGHVLEKATLVIRDGYIEDVGDDISIPPDAVVKDIGGKSIYPGFIDLYSHYGMPQSVSDTTGPQNWNPVVRAERKAADLFQTDKNEAQNLRKIGFTTVATLPRTGIFRGESALAMLTDDVPNSALLKEGMVQSISLHANSSDYPRSLQGRIALIRQTLYDARWYRDAWKAYNKEPQGQDKPDVDLSLDSLIPLVGGNMPAFFEAGSLQDIFRIENLKNEFGFDACVRGSGTEYRQTEALKNTGLRLIVPLNFPEKPDVSTDEVNLMALRHWDFAPENPARLSEAGIEFALTADRLNKKQDFLNNLRKAVKRGFPSDKALASLTTVPAGWLSMSDVLGTIEKGKIANFFMTDGCIFDDKTTILDTWVQGNRYEIQAQPIADVRGNWSITLSLGDRVREAEFGITGKAEKPDTKLTVGETSIQALQTDIEKRLVMFAFPTDSLGHDGVMRFTGLIEGETMMGRGTWGDGAGFTWDAKRTEPWTTPPDTTKAKPVKMAEYPVVYPEGAYGRTALPECHEAVIIKNAVLWTCGPEGKIDRGDILLKKGKIAAVGKNLKTPNNALVIDASGKHITPGLLDAHSHLAIAGGVNEGTHSITSEARIIDVIDPDNINIYRQLAGGLTTSCIIHGSANTIGGQLAVMKLRWGSPADDMLIKSAKPGIKFALGENVKRSNTVGAVTRYPASRMGVEQFIRDSFHAARDYRQEWTEYGKAKKKRKNLIPPRRNLRLEPLVEVLEGKRQIQCHAYRQDEVLSLIRIADDMDFKVGIFIHILEGYKVAEVMKEHGAMPTAFSDWWAYKFEVYDAIPYNGALMHDQDLLVSYNSDNIEIARRMNLEAAKAVKYGGVPEEEALKFVTLNPAIQLGVDNIVGSLEAGKDADLVIWSGPPLSVYSMCEQTWIDGRRYFDLDEDREFRRKIREERTALIQKILQKDK